jgi:hypothetical protein
MAPDRRSHYSTKTSSFYMRSTSYKKQWAPNRWSLTQQKLILFTCVASHTKSKGSRSAVPYSAETYAFYTRSTTYKKQGAPDRRSTHLLLLSTCASPRTKCKGLHRYVLEFIILLIKFSKVFAAQQVSSLMVWLYPKSRERVS